MSLESFDSLLHYNVSVENQVATIEIVHLAPQRALEQGLMPTDPHWELFLIMNQLRADNSVRIVVITGERDGAFMTVEPPPSGAGEGPQPDAPMMWDASTGIVRMHEAMAELDRPIIAKVNGEVIGLGASIMFAADLIVAREDARIVDTHLGMGEVEPYYSRNGVVPGDGGTALVPLFMSPVRAKEFLMLAREYTAADLERMGVINYAVAAAELDALVDDLVRRLLKRPAYALAWTKRVANKHVVEQLHRTLDAGVAYELINMYQLGIEGTDRTRLDRGES